MSFDSLLIHTCDIGQLNQGVVDDYGVPAKTWPIVYDDEPCRLMSNRGKEIKVGAEVVISDWKLFIDDSVVVTEQDRVIVGATTYEILLVQSIADGVGGHHKELYLQRVA